MKLLQRLKNLFLPEGKVSDGQTDYISSLYIMTNGTLSRTTD